MKIVFRTDASLDIGTGHVMRCLTVATACRQRGIECVFLCRILDGGLHDQIRSKGFGVVVLPSLERQPGKARTVETGSRAQYSFWLEVDWHTDALQTTRCLDEVGSVDWLIVDHYAIDVRWEALVRPQCQNMMVIDDLADRSHDCDVLLDQNLGRLIGDYDGLVPEGCIRLIGPKFALLRPEFAALRGYSLARRSAPVLKSLLISMGGVDRDNATGEILQALRECPLPEDCRITVVMGPHAPWLETVRQSAQSLPWRTEVVVNVSDMARLMADSDLAIGAAGSTAWERCCLGVPTIQLVLAQNQAEIAKALSEAGAALTAGAEKLHEVFFSVLTATGCGERLLTVGQAAASISDGFGTQRVIDKLMRGTL